jgi:hypothetical protein
VRTGGCLCGAVRFRVDGASAAGPRDALAVAGAVRWYDWPGGARSGFCADCGSQLFWERADEADISIEMGAFDAPTGLRLAGHIFTAEKGDYYAIADGLPATMRDADSIA